MQPQPASEMAPSQQGADFFNELKESTAPMHGALEQLPLSLVLTSPEITIADYKNYLLCMLPVVQDLEQNIYPVLAEVIPDLNQRRKLPLLIDDLRHLQAGQGEKTVEPLSGTQQHLSIPFAMGIMYVLEGSTLGGRFIGNNVEKVLGYTQETGAKYFSGYGATTGSRWKSFLQQLGQVQAATGAGKEIIEGANFAFNKIYNHFKG